MSSEYTFLRIYKALALNYAREEDLTRLYWNLQDKVLGDDFFAKSWDCPQHKEHQAISKKFEESVPDRLASLLAIDSIAHALHQGGNEVLQKLYPGASYELVKSELDALAGTEKNNEVRKYTRDYFTTLLSDDGVVFLEKGFGVEPILAGRTTKEAVLPAIKEYENLFKAGLASPAEILTLSRYYSDDERYKKAVIEKGLENEENQPIVVGGPASVEMVDKQGHLITVDALKKAFGKFMENFRERNLNVLHCLAPETKIYVQNGKKKAGYYPIEEINIGDKVLTHAGVYRDVRKVLSHSDHDGFLIKLALKNKETIFLTPEHKILTLQGWKEAKNLSFEDVLLTADFPGTKKGAKAAAQNKIGKTLEEYYGDEKANEMKKAISDGNKGKLIGFKRWPNGHKNKGKKLEEIVGEERALEIKINNRIWGKIVGKSGLGAAKTALQRKGKTWIEAYGHPRPMYEDFNGEKNSNWKNGISFEPYSSEFNSEIKLFIRKRDNYICQLCGKTEQEEYKDYNRPLSIHHIDYDKKNSKQNNLVTTCCKCNSLANSNREYHTNFFKGKVQEIIHNGTAILSVEKVPYNGDVYNLEIDEFPSFAGKGLIFHNSDVTVGWILPTYITKGGAIYSSGVDGKQLWVLGELRNDTRVAQKVAEEVKNGNLKSYSIAGSATDVVNMQKGAEKYMQVNSLEMQEITLCERGVNQGALFDIMKEEKTSLSFDDIAKSIPDDSVELPEINVYIENSENPKVVLKADKSNTLTDMISVELGKMLPRSVQVVVSDYVQDLIPVYKMQLVPIWKDFETLHDEDGEEIEKGQRAFHEHDAFSEHPVAVKDHQKFFSGKSESIESKKNEPGKVKDYSKLRDWEVKELANKGYSEALAEMDRRQDLKKPILEIPKITDESKRVFEAYAKDAGNWSGVPMVGGNIGGSKEERGNLTQLKRAGLITTQQDEGNIWIEFTESGKKYAKSLGVDLSYLDKKDSLKKLQPVHEDLNNEPYRPKVTQLKAVRSNEKMGSVLKNFLEWVEKAKGDPDYLPAPKEDRDDKRHQLMDEYGIPDEPEDPEDWETPEEKEEPQIVNEAGSEVELTPEEREELRGHPYATETKTR